MFESDVLSYDRDHIWAGKGACAGQICTSDSHIAGDVGCIYVVYDRYDRTIHSVCVEHLTRASVVLEVVVLEVANVCVTVP